MVEVESQFERNIMRLQLGTVQAGIDREMLPMRIEQERQERAYFAANQAESTASKPRSIQG